MGTTKRAEMFSPASSGSVHIFTSASRALLAWIVHMPGSPALRASSRSRHSSARTSPTMIRLGRIRRLSLTRSRSRISPVPSSPDCRVCSGTQSGWGKRSSKTSSAETTRSPPGDRRGQAVEHRGLAGLGAAGDQDVEAGAHRGLEERRRRAASGCPARPGRASRAARSTNLRMLTAEKPAADALEHDVQPVALGQHRVDERLADVDAPAAGLEHPLDQLLHLRAW